MSSARPLRPVLTALVVLVGCNVEPPVPLEHDPAYAHVASGEARLNVKLAVAPVLVSLDGNERMRWPTLGTAPVDSSSAAPTRSAMVVLADPVAAPPAAPRVPPPPAAPELPRREYQWQPTEL